MSKVRNIFKTTGLLVCGGALGAVATGFYLGSSFAGGVLDENRPWERFAQYGVSQERLVISDALSAQWATAYFEARESGCLRPKYSESGAPMLGMVNQCSDELSGRLKSHPTSWQVTGPENDNS